MSVGVGIVDTGIVSDAVHKAQCFLPDTDQWPAPDANDHGSLLAQIILSHCPGASLIDARTFAQGEPARVRSIVQALDWLIAERVTIINMSFGLRADRTLLARAIQQATDAGIVCVASTPAAGEPVYPAAYGSVIRASGDARCAAGQFSLLSNDPEPHFGAAAGGPAHQAHQLGSGASFACAHVTGELARLIEEQGQVSLAIEDMIRRCCWRGRERRC